MNNNEVNFFLENLAPELDRLKVELGKLTSIREQMDILVDGATQVVTVIDALKGVGATISHVSDSIKEIETKSSTAIDGHIETLKQIASETRGLATGAVHLSDDLHRTIGNQIELVRGQVIDACIDKIKSSERQISHTITNRVDSIESSLKGIERLLREIESKRLKEAGAIALEAKNFRENLKVFLISVLIAQVIGVLLMIAL